MNATHCLYCNCWMRGPSKNVHNEYIFLDTKYYANVKQPTALSYWWWDMTTIALWTRASFLLVLDLRHAEFMYFNTTTLQYKGGERYGIRWLRSSAMCYVYMGNSLFDGILNCSEKAWSLRIFILRSNFCSDWKFWKNAPINLEQKNCASKIKTSLNSYRSLNHHIFMHQIFQTMKTWYIALRRKICNRFIAVGVFNSVVFAIGSVAPAKWHALVL